jgi:FixJ family two-component response regulator
MRVSRAPLIAVIDDDDSFRPALVESLSSLGYGVRGFPSAEELIASGPESSYDCIITDVHLAGMSGIDLKSQLTRRGVNVPVIMITGRSDPTLEDRAAASGAICLLRKPFESIALVVHLERVLSER